MSIFVKVNVFLVVCSRYKSVQDSRNVQGGSIGITLLAECHGHLTCNIIWGRMRKTSSKIW